MGKKSWLALLMALVLLATTVPVRAIETGSGLSPQLYAEDDYGGLAPPSSEETNQTDEKPPRTTTPPDEYGGLAPDSTSQTSTSQK